VEGEEVSPFPPRRGRPALARARARGRPLPHRSPPSPSTQQQMGGRHAGHPPGLLWAPRRDAGPGIPVDWVRRLPGAC